MKLVEYPSLDTVCASTVSLAWRTHGLEVQESLLGLVSDRCAALVGKLQSKREVRAGIRSSAIRESIPAEMLGKKSPLAPAEQSIIRWLLFWEPMTNMGLWQVAFDPSLKDKEGHWPQWPVTKYLHDWALEQAQKEKERKEQKEKAPAA
jgi:hypothetical protein